MNTKEKIQKLSEVEGMVIDLRTQRVLNVEDSKIITDILRKALDKQFVMLGKETFRVAGL